MENEGVKRNVNHQEEENDEERKSGVAGGVASWRYRQYVAVCGSVAKYLGRTLRLQ